MITKRNSMWLRARTGFLVCMLFGLFSGCRYYQREYPIHTDPTTLTEEELLYECDQNYRHPMAHYRLGAYYHSQNMWDKAESKYNDALNLDPAHTPSQAAIVKLFFNRSDRPRAANYADSYIRQSMGSVKQVVLLSTEFQKQGLDDYALSCLVQANQMKPESPEINKALGEYYFKRNDMVQAREYLTRSFNLDRTQGDVANMLGQLGDVIEMPQEL